MYDWLYNFILISEIYAKYVNILWDTFTFKTDSRSQNKLNIDWDLFKLNHKRLINNIWYFTNFCVKIDFQRSAHLLFHFIMIV